MFNLKTISYIACSSILFSSLHAAPTIPDSGRTGQLTPQGARAAPKLETFKGSTHSIAKGEGVTIHTFTSSDKKSTLTVSEDSKQNLSAMTLTSPSGTGSATLTAPGTWTIAVDSEKGAPARGTVVLTDSDEVAFTGTSSSGDPLAIQFNQKTNVLTVNGARQSVPEATESMPLPGEGGVIAVLLVTVIAAVMLVSVTA